MSGIKNVGMGYFTSGDLVAKEKKELFIVIYNIITHQPETLLWLKTILNILTILKHNSLQNKKYVILITSLITLLH